MDETGDILYHQCEAYADDASKRTAEDNEHNNQARRYTRYYVFAERGYEAVDHTDNPAYIEAVRQAIDSLSPAEFEQFFGALHTQIRSHHDPVDRPVELPSAVRKPNGVVYEQDIYLGLDLSETSITDRARELATAYGISLEDNTEVRPVSELSDADLDRWQSFSDDFHEDPGVDPRDTDLTVSAVSGIHVGYPNRQGRHEVAAADDPFDRQADTRLELLPYAPASLAAFRGFLDYHLRCQIRDCFVKMGVVPPEPYRRLGFGKFREARRYDRFSMYPELHTRDGDHTPLIG
ncbi:hypothetical protein [Halohasta salina]|uniref:hypothetical protein n=1 Tax=Halohasta salina TaxID=2961621 RepID=UPI0020A241D8|nr:hypothetical protein [Halohasta salina]